LGNIIFRLFRVANYFEHSQPLQASSTVTNILNHCEHPHLSSYQLMSHKGSQNAKAKALVISFRPAIMSISVPVSSDIQLTPEAQALIENILNQKLKEQDQYYLVIVAGNPGVFFPNPYPYPRDPYPQPYGFLSPRTAKTVQK
jgi:hypothetical protein